MSICGNQTLALTYQMCSRNSPVQVLFKRPKFVHVVLSCLRSRCRIRTPWELLLGQWVTINRRPTPSYGRLGASGKGHLALAVFRCFSCPRASWGILGCLGMPQDALGQLKHLKTARARWPFPDVMAMVVPFHHLFEDGGEVTTVQYSRRI